MRNLRRQPNWILETRVKSDFLRREEEDKLWAVRPWPWRLSLVKRLRVPFSMSHGSDWEAMGSLFLRLEKGTRKIELALLVSDVF